MSIYVFQLEENSQLEALDLTGIVNKRDIENIVAAYASVVTQRNYAPGALKMFKASSPTIDEAIAEAKENNLCQINPKDWKKRTFQHTKLTYGIHLN